MTTPTDRPDLLRVEQAAALLRMSPAAIRSYQKQGNLKAYRIAGKRKLMFRRDAVMALLVPIGGPNER